MHALLCAITLTAALAAQSPGFWETRTKLLIARQETAAALVNGAIYVTGGLAAPSSPLASVERRNLDGSWTLVAPMPTTRHHHGSASVNGKLYVIGGYVSSFNGVDTVDEYDPIANSWRARAKLPRARGALVAVTIGAKIYAVGGVVPAIGVVGDLTVYDPATDQWASLPPMPTPREHLAAATDGTKVYVAGGRVSFLLRNQLEVYDPATNAWSVKTAMPTARGGNGGAFLDGKLLVCGGEGGPQGNFPECEQYDPGTDTWRRMADMSLPLHGIYPVVIGEELIVAGGGTSPGYAATDAVIAFRRLPSGVTRYGVSTPACRGTIELFLNKPPLAGDPGFVLLGSPHAPPSTVGLLLLGAGQDLLGQLVLGMRLHVDPLAPLVTLSVATNALGAATIPLAVPAGSTGGRVFAQCAWLNTASCTGAGPLSATDALDLAILR